MELLLESQMRDRAQRTGRNFDSIFESHIVKAAEVRSLDIFLSHSIKDKELILGVALTLEDLGYTVYIDWRDDPQLNRENVNRDTAVTLRERMNYCKSLFYVATSNSTNSKWMPWELGFKDGNNGRVAIVKISKNQYTDFSGQEYISIYPYATVEDDTTGKKQLWIKNNEREYIDFETWVKGKNPQVRGR